MHFLIKKFSPIILFNSLLIFIYIFYKSEFYWNGDKRDYYFNYYIISLLLIFFSVITFYIKQKIKEYLIITTISLLVSIYVFEGFLIFTKLSKEQLYKKQTRIDWDVRSRSEIYEDLKKLNNEIVVKVAPTNYLNKNYSIFPVAGVSNSKTIYCNEEGYYSIYQSDRYGFNNPDNEWDKKEIEYLLVGDSFTHGACVNRPNDITSVLRTLSNKSALNLGYGSNGPLVEYVALREYLNSNVKKVLWIYYEGNDLGNLEYEKKDNILINYLNDLTFTQDLKLKQNDINNLALNIIERERERERERKRENEKENKKENKKKFKFEIQNFIKIANIRTSIFQPPNYSRPPEPQPSPEFEKILKITKDLTIQNNSKLYFVYLPEYSRYKTKYDDKNYNLVKNIVSKLNIPFIDIHEKIFKKEQNPLKLFPFGELNSHGHYNIEGYKKVAETLYKYTKD